MTYNDLLNELQKLSPEQLDCTVTIHEPYTDEYIPAVHGTEVTNAQDVLDPGHYVIVLKA
jgi:hypothetical protein